MSVDSFFVSLSGEASASPRCPRRAHRMRVCQGEMTTSGQDKRLESATVYPSSPCFFLIFLINGGDFTGPWYSSHADYLFGSYKQIT